MNYPADWTIYSCRSYPAPTAPDVYVVFSPPKKRGPGSVMVEHLADQPPDKSPDEWLANVKRTANQNPQDWEQPLKVNGMPALLVHYRGPSDIHRTMENVYVISHGYTFAIEFSAEIGSGAPQAAINFSIYLDMVKTFMVSP